LRFQLGVKFDTKIVLKETIDDMVKVINVEALLSQSLNTATNIQYDLVDKQEQMSLLNLKSQKANLLPVLSGVYSASKSGMGMKHFRE
jgi:hypothetical protein